MNRVYILGRLGGAPELKETKTGEAYCRLRIATNRGPDQPDWHTVFAFGTLARTCARHLAKGATVFVEGRLNYWQDAASKLYAQSVRAEQIQFVAAGGAKDGHLDNPEGARNPDATAHPA